MARAAVPAAGHGARHPPKNRRIPRAPRTVASGAARLVYGEERLDALVQATDYIRYSSTQGTNALVQRQGPRLGLLAADSTLLEGLAATAEEEDLLSVLVGDRHAVIDVTADDETLAV